MMSRSPDMQFTLPHSCRAVRLESGTQQRGKEVKVQAILPSQYCILIFLTYWSTGGEELVVPTALHTQSSFWMINYACQVIQSYVVFDHVSAPYTLKDNKYVKSWASYPAFLYPEE